MFMMKQEIPAMHSDRNYMNTYSSLQTNPHSINIYRVVIDHTQLLCRHFPLVRPFPNYSVLSSSSSTLRSLCTKLWLMMHNLLWFHIKKNGMTQDNDTCVRKMIIVPHWRTSTQRTPLLNLSSIHRSWCVVIKTISGKPWIRHHQQI